MTLPVPDDSTIAAPPINAAYPLLLLSCFNATSTRSARSGRALSLYRRGGGRLRACGHTGVGTAAGGYPRQRRCLIRNLPARRANRPRAGQRCPHLVRLDRHIDRFDAGAARLYDLALRDEVRPRLAAARADARSAASLGPGCAAHVVRTDDGDQR